MPSLKTILKQHHFNVNRAHMNKCSCMQILISHGQLCILAKFAYMQTEICIWSQPGANLKYLHMKQILYT